MKKSSRRLIAGGATAGLVFAASMAPANAWWNWGQQPEAAPTISNVKVPEGWPVDPQTLTADPNSMIKMDQTMDVEVQATLKSLNQTVTIKGGSFTGTAMASTTPINPDDIWAGNYFTLDGAKLNLPPAGSQIKLGSLPLADATFQMDTVALSAAIDVGKVLAGTGETAFWSVAQVDVKLKEVKLSFLPWWNLVGDSCHTAKPVEQFLSGPYSLTAANNFSSDFALGKFTSCGFTTTILNWIAPGDGNTFKASFSPVPAAEAPTT